MKDTYLIPGLGDVSALVSAGRDFFAGCASGRLLCLIFGNEIGMRLAETDQEQRFEAFTAACGCDPVRFFEQVADAVAARREVVIGDVRVPVTLLTRLLAVANPSDSLVSVKDVEDLADTGAVRVREQDREDLQAVIAQYPVRLSGHVIRQAMVSPPVAAQYLPFCGELDRQGLPATFEGHARSGVIEQMYQNRVIFLLTMRCPVYCRFCFRKHKDLRREKSPTTADVEAAVRRVGRQPRVEEILITGGEPLIHRKNLETALDGLMGIDHVRAIRIATRSVAYFPRLFLKNGGELIRYLESVRDRCRGLGKRLEVGVHFIHGDEVSMESLEIISRLSRCGIRVYLQTPFLGGINDNGPALARLFSLLAGAGCEIYYIFTPCHPIRSTRSYWTPIANALEAYGYLRSRLSDRSMPKLCTATSLGKIEWGSSGWAVEPDGPGHIWIRTPYTREYFSAFSADPDNLPPVRENREGTLDVRMMAEMGDDGLFMGAGLCLSGGEGGSTSAAAPNRDAVRVTGQSGEIFRGPETVAGSLYRTHLTRVEAVGPVGKEELDYIRSDPRITDVIIHGGIIPDEELTGNLSAIPHLIRIRLVAPRFHEHPASFARELMDRPARWDGKDPVSLQWEIEAWFTRSREVLPDHGRAVETLSGKGVRVYANVPLLAGVNADPDTMVGLAHRLRAAGIDFHHAYVAGLPVQERWPAAVAPADVIRIASGIRTRCSGREIPLYVIKTDQGEMDFSC